jgi:hypothetical protein
MPSDRHAARTKNRQRSRQPKRPIANRAQRGDTANSMFPPHFSEKGGDVANTWISKRFFG